MKKIDVFLYDNATDEEIHKLVEVLENLNFVSRALYSVEQNSRPINLALDGANSAATLSGLYNCEVCGEEKCRQPGICKDCLTPPIIQTLEG